MSEKALARRLDVQFTPTLLFFDEHGQGRGAAQRLLSAAPVRGRARLRGRQARAKHVARRLSRAARAGRREPAPRRRALLPAAAARSSAESGRQAARGAVRDDPIAVRATSCIARASSVRRCARCSNGFDVARFAFGAPTRLTTPAGGRDHRAGLGDRARRDVRADPRVLRRGWPRGVPHRRLSAAVPSRVVARLRGERRVSRRAVVSALHPGAGGAGFARAGATVDLWK